MPLSTSKLVHDAVEKTYRQCDVDGNGVDVSELHVALLLLYDKINARLPVHIAVPTHDGVRELLKRHDLNGNGHLEFDEFYSCCKEMLDGGEEGRVTETIPFLVVRQLVVKLAFLPLAAWGIKKSLVEGGGFEGANRVPDSVLVLTLEAAIRLAQIGMHAMAER